MTQNFNETRALSFTRYTLLCHLYDLLETILKNERIVMHTGQKWLVFVDKCVYSNLC
jgi:hypothetical protein